MKYNQKSEANKDSGEAKADKPKMTNDDLIKIIKAHRKDSFGANNSELTRDRADAMDRYHGRPFGDEKTGRSKVVMRDVSETVDWAMPAIMRVLLHSGRLAEFSPVGPEDEELAEQETDYVNHVIMKDNAGFLLIHDAVKDGLLLKNMYADYDWVETDKVRERTYNFENENEMAYTFMKLKEDSEKIEVIEAEQSENNPQGYSVRFKINKKLKRVKANAIPPEELRVSKRCRASVKEAPFVEREEMMSRSDMLEMGMPKKFVADLSPWSNRRDKDNNSESNARDSVSDESDLTSTHDLDKSQDDIKFSKIYMKCDFDGDGIAELRCIKLANDKIPTGGDDDDWNYMVDEIPMASGSAKRVPHRHIGESIYDELKELTRIKTILTRQLLDNIYRTNNNEYVINENANWEDFQKSAPGVAKRIKGKTPVGDAAQMMRTESIVDKLLPAIDYFKTVGDNRTGINDTTTNVDPDVLKQSTKGAFMETLSRASQKIEMMTRMIAETFCKELVLGVHTTIIKNQDFKRVVKMRGQYVDINPSEWEERTDLDVTVGLGSGTGEEKLVKLQVLYGIQADLQEQGLIGPDQSEAMFTDIAKALGAENPEKYIIDPKSPEFQENKQYLMGLAAQQQGQGNPLAEAEQIKAQAKLQSDQMSNQHKAEMKQLEEQNKLALEQFKENNKLEYEKLKGDIQLQVERMKLDSQEAQKAAELEISAMVKGYEVDVGAKGVGAGLQDGE